MYGQCELQERYPEAVGSSPTEGVIFWGQDRVSLGTSAWVRNLLVPETKIGHWEGPLRMVMKYTDRRFQHFFRY